MKITKLPIIIFLMLIVFTSCSDKPTLIKTIILSELSNPHEIIADDNHLIISDGVEGTNIYVYSVNDLSLYSTFGGTGDSNGKFKVSGGHEVDIDIRNDTLLISSHWKTSLFTKKGDLIKQSPIKTDTYGYSFLDNHYTGSDDTTVNDIMYYTFNLYDKKFGFVKEITRIAGSNQGENGLQMLVRKYQGLTYKEKFYFKGKSNEFEIEVYDSQGSKTNVITQTYERIPVSEQHIENIYKGYREHPFFGQYFEDTKHRFVFPDFLPAIYNMKISDDFIYVLTYKELDAKTTELYKLDLKGRLINKLNVPLKWNGNTETFPYTISKDHLYQLHKNKSEKWELRIVKL